MKLSKLFSGITGTVLAGCFAFAALACLVTGLDLEGVNLWSLVWRCALAAAVCALCYSGRLGLVPACLLAVAAGYLWQEGLLLQGLEFLVYRISRLLSIAYGWEAVRWSYGSIRDLVPGVGSVLYLYGGGIAMVTAWSLCRRQSVAPAVLLGILPVVLCLLVTDTVPKVWCLALFLFALVTVLLCSGAHSADMSQLWRLAVYTALPVALAVAILFAAIPKKGYDGEQRAQQWADTLLTDTGLQRLWLELTGQEGLVSISIDANSVDLTALGRRSASNLEVMKIFCNYTGTVYLRSRALDTYDGTAWTDSGEESPLPWPDGEDVAPAGEMRITTRYAHRMLYMPYYVTSLELEGTGRGIVNDRELTDYSVAWGAPPDREYFQQRYPNPNQTNHLVDRTLLAQGTQLPRSTKTWAKEILPYIVGQTRSEYHIAQRIGNYVSGLGEYDLNAQRMPSGKKDFAQWFVQDAEKGYCVHYATAAAVLLKAAGIPARYVTGYMVQSEYGRTVTVRDKDAHAWVEYWLPGFGWTVLEATPAAAAPQATTQPVTTAPTTAETTPQTPQTPGTTQPKPETVRREMPGWIVPALTVFLALAALWLQWRLRLWLLGKWLNRGSVNQRIINRWRWVARLSRVTGVGPERALFETAQRAKFGPDRLPAAELEAFDSQICAAVGILRGRNVFFRLWYRLVLALY